MTGAEFTADAPSAITSLRTTLAVPAEPPATGTLLVWPGLGPIDGGHILPISDGVLQSVLTWGSPCIWGSQPPVYSTWRISAQYVETKNALTNTGCRSGPFMNVTVGDSLTIVMSQKNDVWTQVITDMRTKQSVSFTLNMNGQAQSNAYFAIEGFEQNPVAAVTFTNTTMTFSSKPPNPCALAALGMPDEKDSFTPPVVTNGGRTCSIANMTLYSPGQPHQPTRR